MFFKKIYDNLCNRNKNKGYYTDNIHRHHIVPKHAGGKDCEDNYTYLTIREHQIAHYLLWKIHRNINDLRAMYMLSARLTKKQREIIGKWCYDNKIGLHNPKWDSFKLEWSAKGGLYNKENNIGFLSREWIDSEEGRYWASYGGKIGGAKNKKEKLGIFEIGFNTPEHLKNCSKGGKAMKGMVLVRKPDGTKTRVHNSVLDEKLAEGYLLGWVDEQKLELEKKKRSFRFVHCIHEKKNIKVKPEELDEHLKNNPTHVIGRVVKNKK